MLLVTTLNLTDMLSRRRIGIFHVNSGRKTPTGSVGCNLDPPQSPKTSPSLPRGPIDAGIGPLGGPFVLINWHMNDPCFALDLESLDPCT